MYFLPSRKDDCEKDNLRLGENICRWYNWQRLNSWNINTAPTTLYLENKQLVRKMSRRPIQTFLQENIQMAHKQRKTRAVVLVRETDIKTTVRHHLSLVTTAIIKKSTDCNSWRRQGEKGALQHCRWESKLPQSLGKQHGGFLNENRATIPYHNPTRVHAKSFQSCPTP